MVLKTIWPGTACATIFCSQFFNPLTLSPQFQTPTISFSSFVASQCFLFLNYLLQKMIQDKYYYSNVCQSHLLTLIVYNCHADLFVKHDDIQRQRFLFNEIKLYPSCALQETHYAGYFFFLVQFWFCWHYVQLVRSHSLWLQRLCP